MVKISRHDGIRTIPLGRWNTYIMSVTHKYNSTVIDGLTCRYLFPGIIHRGIYLLIVTSDTVCITIGIFLSTADIRNIITVSHSCVIHYVSMTVSQIYSLSPIRFNGDGRHTFRYIPIGSLVEDTTTDAIQIFIGIVTVCKVVRSTRYIAVSICCSISSCGIIITRRATSDRGNLPTRYDSVLGIVTSTYIIVIRQLYLVIVEIETPEVLIGTHQGETGSFNSCSGRLRLATSSRV